MAISIFGLGRRWI